MHVAILDDGVNASYYRLDPLKHDLAVGAGGEMSKRIPVLEDSHGTVCAAIISKYSPAVTLSSIKVLNDDGTGNIAKLLLALCWCRENRVDIVHLSLGTVVFGDFPAVSQAIIRLLEKDILVVAAVSNDNKFTLPAHMAGVLGVVHTNALLDNRILVQNEAYQNILIQASGRQLLRNHEGKIKITPPSNSFAAPVVTAQAAEIVGKMGIRSAKEIIGYMGKAESYSHKNFLPVYLPHCFTRARAMEELPYQKQMFFACDDTADTLVCTSLEQIEEGLLHRENEVRNVLYTGTLPPEQKTQIEQKIKGFLWDEQDLGVVGRSEKTAGIPLVGIQGDTPFVIQLLQLLGALFYEEGFYSMAVTDISLGYLYGFYWMQNMEELPGRLSYMENRFASDVLLFGTESFGKQESQFDCIIYKGSPSVNEKNPSAFFLENITEQTVKRLFENIIKYFD